MKQFNESVKGKLFNYFKGRLKIKQSTKGWWRCDCIWCGGKYSMGIHLEQSTVHCFKCGEKKSPLEALMEIENFETFAQVYEFINIQQEYEYYESYARVARKEIKPIELPESFTLLNQGDSQYGRSARAYMAGRGFNINRLSYKGVGYCTRGDYGGYIIFPFYRKGKLVYFQGRKYLSFGPKMQNPSSEEFGIGKEQIIYNQDALYIYNKTYVVESITNAETLGDRGVATLGKSVSPYQLYNIIACPCERIIMILDSDAYKEAIELAMQIVNYKKVKVVKLPEGDKDVNDLGKHRTLEFVSKTNYQDYNQLFRLKLNFNEGYKRPQFTYSQIGINKGLGRAR
jgi:DNA primase